MEGAVQGTGATWSQWLSNSVAKQEKIFHANVLKQYHERSTEEVTCGLQFTAAVNEYESSDSKDLCLLLDFQEETYQDVIYGDELSAEKLSSAQSLLSEYRDIFTDVSRITKLVKHNIVLTNDQAVSSKAYFCRLLCVRLLMQS